uniref:Uncharacterized protein n=1 Tax=Lepeophtheirus salmonis TaxID=72036 RepID=A0A0K2UG28_LEPSM
MSELEAKRLRVSNLFRHKSISNKKIFTVDAILNRINDGLLAESRAQVEGSFRTKHPVQVMTTRHPRVQEGAAFLKGEPGCLLAGRLMAFVLTRPDPHWTWLFGASRRAKRTMLLTRISMP